MSDKVRLGGFLLDEPFSSGGMGTVWRAHHEHTGRAVAIKVIAGIHARNPLYLDGFEREVRAVARMTHPRIVQVFDYGTVDSRAEAASEGALPRAAPWLAMELATRGSLSALGRVGDWGTLKAILFDILDALAHSHARYVIHRDLKPGNILLTDTPDGVHCKLTDFGIAHASGAATSTREVFASSAGTPWYMAPEQVDSRWRDYGPWTDLYALGCVAFQLASGTTPFVGDSAVRVARQQLFDRPPELHPKFEVPPGFAQWVGRLLVKEIPHRFRRAADAAWALHQISPRDRESIHANLAPSSEGIEVETAISGSVTTDMSFDSQIATLTFLSDALEPTPVPTKSLPMFSLPSSLLTFSLPPMPESWRPPHARPITGLLGAGLGLYRMRETPFVGRTAERDRIWEAMRSVVTERAPRTVFITGEAGTGKSRLARWIAQRLHELGVSSHLEALHGAIQGPGHGTPAMLERYLGCSGLDLERSFLRIRRVLTMYASENPDVIKYFAGAVTRLMHPTGEAPGVPLVRFANQEERFQPAVRLLRHICDRRPAVIVLDDVQWGFDSLELTRRLMERDYPLLVIATLREDQLADRPLERGAVRELADMPRTESIELGPLTAEEHYELMDALLVLEPSLRERVHERTYGSPLFVAELIGSWIRRGNLRSGPQGFRLESGIALPDSLHALWNERLDRTLAKMEDPAAARAALELGATLGMNVQRIEWLKACRSRGVAIDDSFIDTLGDAGFLEPTETGWVFRHQMLRESVVAAAREAGRATGHHRVVSDMLEFDESADSQFRRAMHYLAVEDYEAAAQPLLTASNEMVKSGRFREAEALGAYLDDVLAHVGDGHPLQPRAIEHRLELMLARGEIAARSKFGAQMAPIAEQNGWWSALAACQRSIAREIIEFGNPQEGMDLLEEALKSAQKSKDAAAIGLAHLSLSATKMRFGDLSAGEDHANAARDLFQIAADAEGEASALSALAEVQRLRGNFKGAFEFNGAAVDLSRREGRHWGLVNHLVMRGEISMSEQDYASAVKTYEEAHRLATITNHSNLPVATMNLGLAKVYLGDLRQANEARQLLLESERMFATANWNLYGYYNELGLAVCAAALGDRDEWDRRFPGLFERASADMASREGAEHCVHAARQWLFLEAPRYAEQALEIAEVLVPDGYRNEFITMIERERENVARLETREVDRG